jgi:hypothetical protein
MPTSTGRVLCGFFSEIQRRIRIEEKRREEKRRSRPAPEVSGRLTSGGKIHVSASGNDGDFDLNESPEQIRVISLDAKNLTQIGRPYEIRNSTQALSKADC